MRLLRRARALPSWVMGGHARNFGAVRPLHPNYRTCLRKSGDGRIRARRSHGVSFGCHGNWCSFWLQSCQRDDVKDPLDEELAARVRDGRRAFSKNNLTLGRRSRLRAVLPCHQGARHETSTSSKFLHVTAGVAVLLAVSGIAQAQTYPTRPITMVVRIPSGWANRHDWADYGRADRKLSRLVRLSLLKM